MLPGAVDPRRASFPAGARASYVRRARALGTAILDHSATTAIALCAVVIAVCAHFFGHYALDDSYIGYANAQNLAHGGGFAFNPGDRLLTTSAPLVVPVYAFLDRYFGIGEVWSGQVLSALSFAAVSFAAFKLALRMTGSRWAALATSLVFVLSPTVLLMWSHETLLWIALVLVGLELIFSGRKLSGSAVLGVSMLARQETILLLPFVIAAIARRAGARAGATCAAVAFAPFALWALYALPTFGSTVSNSVAAKHAQMLTGGYPYLNGLLIAIAKLYAEAIPPLPFVLATCAIAFGLALALVVRKASIPVTWIVAWAAVVTAFYVAAQVHFFVWFGVQFAVLASVAVAIQAAFAERALREARAGKRVKPLAVLAAAGCCVLVAVHLAFLGAVLANPGLTTAYDDMLVMPEIGTNNYYKLATFVRARTKPSDSIAYPEIGQLRFIGQRRIIDYDGLATPGVAQRALDGNTIWTFERYRPDVFVDAVGNWQYIVAPLEYPWFERAYVRGESATFAPVAGKTTFVLYRLAHPSAIPQPEEIDRAARIGALPYADAAFAIVSQHALSAIDVRLDARACSGEISLLSPGLPTISEPIVRLAYSRIQRARIDVPAARRAPGRKYVLELRGCSLASIRPPQVLRHGFVLWQKMRGRGPAPTAINAYYPSPAERNGT